ncbi:MAG: beta-ketoadipyl CoA thiolase [Deltaproteobacteria bacterium RIFCSPLOWO2_12_FULL_60_19]|nr:MAG: beta-ketoadipyl CoA thiolase [Deltaproteobacteria bacterium RIFCSPLOWO2_12_FULL_60_19]
MREAVIVDAVRTPIGKHGGILKDIRPDDLGAHIIAKLVERTGIRGEEVEDVYFGCTNQAGEDSRNVARNASLLAGLPHTVPGCTVNRLCGSGLEAINQAARAIEMDHGDLFIAGGVESMTRSPWVMLKGAVPFQQGNATVYDSTVGWRFPNPRLGELYPLIGNGESAELIAEKYDVGRKEQDACALESHRRAARAAQDGLFKDEIIPIAAPQKREGPVLHDRDEGPRPDTSMEKLAALKAVFKKNGTVTAGNSSQISDGASAMLVTTPEKAAALKLKPLARIVASAVAGVDPSYFGIGPVPATLKVLKRAGLTLDRIDLVELNEAFASQAIACVKELGLDPKKVNVNGGAIALGHPLGCSGARILTTLAHEMKRRGARYGLATMCIGVGQGIATIVERVA